MGFIEPTWREGLRGIEASLSANANRSYVMGFHAAVRCSTLADASERRNGRIWTDLAAVPADLDPMAIEDEKSWLAEREEGMLYRRPGQKALGP